MHNKMIFTGAVFCGIAVILGAFGAHALKAMLTPESLQSFQTGVQYQMLHGLEHLYPVPTVLKLQARISPVLLTK